MRNTVLLVSVLAINLCAKGSNLDRITATNILDASGAKLASGLLCFQGTDANSNPISFQAGGAGQLITKPICTAITNGAIRAFEVPDSNHTQPAGVCYAVTVQPGNRLLSKCVHVTTSPWNLDNFPHPGANVVPPMGRTANGSLDVSGAVAGGDPSQYQTAVYLTGTTLTGVGPGTIGYPLVSGGATAYPSFTLLPDPGAQVFNVTSPVYGASPSNTAAQNATAFASTVSAALAVHGTVFIPPGTFNYSSGLDFSSYGNLECAPGGILNYTGTAHAVDIAATGLSSSTADWNPYFITGCTFKGAGSASDGIHVNPYTVNVRITNNYFHDFGSASIFEIDFVDEVWWAEVAFNQVMNDDGVLHQFLNIGGPSSQNDGDDQVWVHDNVAGCIVINTANDATCGLGISVVSGLSTIERNNLYGWFPIIRDSNAITTVAGLTIQGNQIATTASVPNGYGIIQFGNSSTAQTDYNLTISRNKVLADNINSPLLGPTLATSLIANARVIGNDIYGYAGTYDPPMIHQADLTGQTGNIEYGNTGYPQSFHNPWDSGYSSVTPWDGLNEGPRLEVTDGLAYGMSGEAARGYFTVNTSVPLVSLSMNRDPWTGANYNSSIAGGEIDMSPGQVSTFLTSSGSTGTATYGTQVNSSGFGVGTLAASTANNLCYNTSVMSGYKTIATCTSLRNYKTNIEPLRSGLKEALEMKPVSYISKTSGREEAHFIAEDIAKLDPKCSTYDENGELVGVNDGCVLAIAIKAIQEQEAEIERLKNEIRSLKEP